MKKCRKKISIKLLLLLSAFSMYSNKRVKTLILLFSHLFGCWKCWWWQWWDDRDHHGSNPAVCFSWSDFNDFLMCEIRSLSYCCTPLRNEQFFTVSHTVAAQCLKVTSKKSHFYKIAILMHLMHLILILMHFVLILIHFTLIWSLFWCIWP